MISPHGIDSLVLEQTHDIVRLHVSYEGHLDLYREWTSAKSETGANLG